MSNKLVKVNNEKRIITEHKKRIMLIVCLIVLSIAFVYVWINVFLNSNNFEEKMDNMVLGVDYFVEDIIITDKRIETDVNDTIHENYFFYYHDGDAYDYHKRMQVPENVFRQYKIGDKISSYTTDHVQYSYEKYGILPNTEFRNNEIMKCVGVLLGIAIFMLALFIILHRKLSIHQK